MTTRKSATAEIAAIEDLMADLEKRLKRLNGTARTEAAGASDDIHDFVSGALDGIMKRVRNSTSSISDTVAEEATRVGADVFRRVMDEVEARPLALLAIAAGIGYIFGMSQRR